MNQDLRGELHKNHPLAKYTSWVVGGPTKIFYQPADLNDLVLFLQTLSPNENIIWLGSGTNVLIPDSGIDGVVIYTKSGLSRLEQINVTTIRAEAGVTCVALAKYCAFFAGIPGTIGGALAMNAGAFGDETWNHIINVETIDRKGNINTRTPKDFQINYRNVICPKDEWFISSQFSFSQANPKTINQQIKKITMKRAATQPIGELTCGSVFRNPKNDYAARLIEISGLKGKQIGGAKVSEKHANFIVNQGNATARDIEKLINYVQNEVKRQQGVELELEIIKLKCK